MRSVELAKIATAAEALRLRRLAHRQAMRVAFAAGAAVFAIGVVVVLHFALYILLLRWLTPMISVLIVLALDVVAAVILGVIAMKDTPDTVEVEAKQIRVQALIEMKRSLTFMGMAAELTGMVVRTGARRGVRRGTATVIGELASRLIGR